MHSEIDSKNISDFIPNYGKVMPILLKKGDTTT